MERMHASGEDYLEAILWLEDESGQARSVDIARELEVSRPSVNKAMGKLKEQGYVTQELYSGVRLTEKGREYAARVGARHKTLHRFLTQVLGVDDETAQKDACGMEHGMSAQSAEALSAFLQQFLNQTEK